ncbi:MAG: LysR family transcriptional regulator [Pseudomonadota bacterium]
MEQLAALRAAYLVASHGSVSAAAETLGVHRSTVMRKIDELENTLGRKLFHRHPKGYTPTEVGRALLQSAEELEHKYNEVIAQLKTHGTELSGEISLSLPGPIAPIAIRASDEFREKHPDCQIKLKITEELPGLEFGEVDIAIWPQHRPQVDSYVVLPLFEAVSGLYASQRYIDQYGMPETLDDLRDHKVVTASTSVQSAPSTWLRKLLSEADFPESNIALVSNCRATMFRATIDGVGIGILPAFIAEPDPTAVRVLPDIPCPAGPTFFTVTHVDVHRTKKIQEFLICLKATVEGMMNGAEGAERMVLH